MLWLNGVAAHTLLFIGGEGGNCVCLYLFCFVLFFSVLALGLSFFFKLLYTAVLCCIMVGWRLPLMFVYNDGGLKIIVRL